jgi:hypothetical protein
MNKLPIVSKIKLQHGQETDSPLPHPRWIKFDIVNIFSCKTSHIKHLILRDSFKSQKDSRVILEKPVFIKNKYIDRIV